LGCVFFLSFAEEYPATAASARVCPKAKAVGNSIPIIDAWLVVAASVL
jgi:hypothetical protein